MARFDAMPHAVHDPAAPAGTNEVMTATFGSPDPLGFPPVNLTAWWTVHSSAPAALAAAGRLLPHWEVLHPSDMTSQGVTVGFEEDSTSSAGLISSQAMLVQSAPLGVDESVVRIDVIVDWRHARTAAENLPAASLLTVTEQVVKRFGAEPVKHQVTITDKATIGRVSELIDGLPNNPSELMMSCPAEPAGDTGFTLQFRDSADGPVNATVTIPPGPSGPCSGWVNETIGASTASGGYQLDDTDLHTPLYTQIAALAGLPVD